MRGSACAVLLALVVGFLGGGCQPAANEPTTTLTLATTTSTENSGLLAHIHPDFEQKTGIAVNVIPKGTGASLQLGRDGNVDVVLVHARDAEDEFIAEGYGTQRYDVMYNDFVIIGPKDDPAGIAGSKDAPAAFKAILEAKVQFVSRGDNSGTHMKEQALWTASSVELIQKETEITKGDVKKVIKMVMPTGEFYSSIGSGMGKAIGHATEKRSYTLADRGTYYAYALADEPRTDLVILCEGDERLSNPYGVIPVSPGKHPGVKHDAAMKYVEWLTSPATQKMIAEFKVNGKVLFHPANP
jgi:tungstate transport system substrate-binding protein